MTTPEQPTAPPLSQPVILTPGVPGGNPQPAQAVAPPVPQPQPAPVPVDDGLQAEFADEEVMFRRDGTVIWRVDGQRSVLRRPKFKELRVLHEEINALAEQSRAEREPLQDDLRAMTEGISQRLASIDTTDPDATQEAMRLERELREVQTSDEFQKAQAALRMQRQEADAELLRWFYDSVLVRFGRPVPRVDDPEDLPGWCIDATFTRDLLMHWSSVPRRPGVV